MGVVSSLEKVSSVIDGNSVYTNGSRRGVDNRRRLLDMEDRRYHNHYPRDNDNKVEEFLENRHYYFSTSSSTRRNNNYRPSSPSSYSSGSSHPGPPMREIEIRNTNTSIIDTIEYDRLMSEYGRLYGRQCSMIERMKTLEVELRDMQTYLMVNGGGDVIGGSSSGIVGGG